MSETETLVEPGFEYRWSHTRDPGSHTQLGLLGTFNAFVLQRPIQIQQLENDKLKKMQYDELFYQSCMTAKHRKYDFLLKKSAMKMEIWHCFRILKVLHQRIRKDFKVS